MNVPLIKVHCVKFGNIVGYLYTPASQPKTGLIMLGGAPGMGDDGKSLAAKIAAQEGICVIRPDYIGMSRSDGKFSFRSAVDTIYKCMDLFSGRITALNIVENKSLPKIEVKNIILSGGSFGGCVAPFVDLYRKTPINDVLLIMPVSDWRTMNPPHYKGDETADEFENIMSIGLKNIWRGYSSSEWPQVVKGKLKKYNPIDNTQLLKNKRVYIYHGTKDKSVNWHDSFNYYLKLKKESLVESVMFEKLINHGHSSSASAAAMRRFINTYKKTIKI